MTDIGRPISERLGETVELLQQLIRNKCVNDGSPESGSEIRNADTLRDYIGDMVATQTYDAAPDRRSLVARIEGTDKSAPSLCFLGHTDVVPALDQAWRHDPFGGELIAGEVWGRGAIDMLNMTASMAVTLRHFGESGFRPRGDLIFVAVADEEARAEFGSRYLLSQHKGDVMADYVITEGGGWPLTPPPRLKLSWMPAEKGINWIRLKIGGTAAHASNPYGTDNALVNASEVVRRISEHQVEPVMSDLWRSWVHGMGFDAITEEALLDMGSLMAAAEAQGLDIAKTAYACNHMTLTPTRVSGGTATNSIPERVEIDLDVRTLPGQGHEDILAELSAALGDVSDRVEFEWLYEMESSESPMDEQLIECVTTSTRQLLPNATLVPKILAGATDAPYFRREGAKVYGFGLTSGNLSPSEFPAMFHGANERIDLESIDLTTRLWADIAERFLS